MSRTHRLWLLTHRYLGLGFGALFVLLGLTGSILVFHQELDEWLNPKFLTVRQLGKRLSLDRIVAGAHHAFPELRGPTAMRLPRTDHSAVRLTFEWPQGSRLESIEVAVDPYTAQVLGRRDAENHLIAVIYSLHYRLLLDQGIGMTMVGVAGVLTIVSSVSGLKLWLPRWRQLRSALSIKWFLGAKRLNFDLHRASGFWTSAVLLTVAFTGVVMCFYDYAYRIVELAFSVTPDPTVYSRSNDTTKTIEFEQLIRTARTRFPEAEAGYLSLPLDSRESFRVFLRQPGEIRQSLGDTVVWINRYNGKVLAVRDALRRQAGDRFLDWQFPLHNGEAFGIVGRIAVLIVGIVPALLYASGIVIWWKRHKGRARATRLRVAR